MQRHGEQFGNLVSRVVVLDYDGAARTAGEIYDEPTLARPLTGDELKYIGKQLVTGTLPKSVIHRKDKMGFTTPIGTFK